MIELDLIKSKIRKILKLAIPVAVAFLAIGLMGIVDTIIVGNYDTHQLAYMGIANSVFMILFTTPVALLQGVLIKSSQKFGARKFASCGKIYNEGKKYLIILAVVFTTIGMCGEFIISALGQNEQMSKQGGRILMIFSASIPFILMNVNANFFLQSIKRPHIAMYSNIIANVLNLLVNPALVHGYFFFPEMGAMGSAASTLIVRIFLAAFSTYYIYRMKKNPKLNKRFGLDRKYETWWNDSKNTRRIGIGAAITTLSINGSFAMSSIFAGWMGEEIMATYVIITTTGGIFFMLFFSLSQATAITVANDFGKKDSQGIVISMLSGLIILIFAIMLSSIIYYTFPEYIYRIFSKDMGVINRAAILIGLIIYELIADSLPLGVVSALNGRGDVKIPTIFQIISYLGVRITSCYILAFIFGLGLKGIIIGLSFAGISSFILNLSRFVYLINKDKNIGLKQQ